MSAITQEENILLGQALAQKIAKEIVNNIDEAITHVVLIGMLPFEDAPEVKRQVWAELALECAGRLKSHGDDPSPESEEDEETTDIDRKQP